MKLTQRNGVFYLRVQVDGTDIRRSTGKTDRKEATAWAKNLVTQLKDARNATELAETVQRIRAAREPLELRNALNVWQKTPKRREPGKQAQKTKASIWLDFTAWCNAAGASMVHEVTEELAAGYVHQLRTAGRFDRTVQFNRGRKVAEYQNALRALSAKTVNEYHGACSQVMAVCWERAGLPRNPFAKIPKLTGRKTKREAFTREELANLLDAAKDGDGMLQELLIAGACTGLRLGDLAGLNWQEVNLESGWICKELGKTGALVRIPIMPRFRDLLESNVEKSAKTGAVLQALAAAYRGNEVSRRFRQLCERVGLEAVRATPGRDRRSTIRGVHSLRHTFVYLAAESGVPMPTVQAIVGHLTPSMTRAYADHATEKATERAMALLGDPFAENDQMRLDWVPDEALRAEYRRRFETER